MNLDYKALGLKCGLEIHQQLDTGKLFCRTPSLLREDKPDFTIERKLRPVASETGQFDKAALEAFEKNLTYIYEGYDDTISLIELDEEPPQKCDGEALKTILEISLMANATIMDELFVMRKMVIDGSNTSGFQRTMLTATGGSIPLANKELGVQTIALEEDSARPMERADTHVIYRLDRLGIPLIELATAPGIETPEEAKEAARAIGEIMRRTCRVKRGLGTIRQDLNISIREGARIEIKGVQELEIIDEYVRREAMRQIGLVEVKKELEKRGAKKENLKSDSKDVSKIFAKTEAKLVKTALDKKQWVMGIRLEKFSGLIGKELQPNRRLGTEFASYVKARAGLKGIFHSDELPNYGITEQEKDAVAKELGCKKEDAFVLVVSSKEKCEKALEVVLERAKQCLIGVPEETRGAIGEGNSEYQRPLPGAARMYPETDLASIVVDKKIVEGIRKNLPLTVKERELLYKKIGLNEKHVNEMKLSNYARFFEGKVSRGSDAKKTAIFLLETLVEAKRNNAKIEKLSEKQLEELVDAVNSGKIQKEIQVRVIVKKCENPMLPLEILLKEIGAGSANAEEIEKTVKMIVEKNIGLVKEKGFEALKPLMGDVMKELKGKASGNQISEALKKELQKHAQK